MLALLSKDPVIANTDLRNETGDAASQSPLEAIASVDPEAPPRKLVLLVEDNHADVFLIEQAIEFHHVPVQLMVAEDGEAALQYFEQLARSDGDAQLPAIVLLDLNLPKKSGTEVLASVRARSEFRDLPIIILTSSDSAQDRQEATRLGANRYFRKPTSYHEFLQIGAILNELLRDFT